MRLTISDTRCCGHMLGSLSFSHRDATVANRAFYFPHLLLPLVAALIFGNRFSWSASWVEGVSYSYLSFALPHLAWAAISLCFRTAKSFTTGGFIGAHLLLGAVGILVATSSAPEAANGWFIYFLGSPLSIAVGSIVGRRLGPSRDHEEQ